MQTTVVNTKTNVSYQYNVEELHFVLSDELSQKKLRVYFACTLWAGGEVVNPKKRDDRPLEIDLANNSDPRIVQAMELLKQVIEEAQQARVLKMHPGTIKSSSPSPISIPKI